MARVVEPDLATLQADIHQLRADFAKMTADMRGAAGNGIYAVGEKAQESAETAWNEVKRQAGQLSQEIYERPFALVLATFAAGVILGVMVNSRRN